MILYLNLSMKYKFIHIARSMVLLEVLNRTSSIIAFIDIFLVGKIKVVFSCKSKHLFITIYSISEQSVTSQIILGG